MKQTRRQTIEEILGIVESVVDDATTERVLFDWDEKWMLTRNGEEAAYQIGLVLDREFGLER